MRKYNASRGGHAPGDLRGLLAEALDSPGRGPWWDALRADDVFYDDERQRWWEGLSSRGRALWLVGQLWNCSDIGRFKDCPGCGDTHHTYAQTVRCLKRSIIEEEKP